MLVAGIGIVAALGASAPLVVATASAAPAASHKVTGGKSRISLNPSARHAVAAHHYRIAATGKARFNGVTLTAPVTGGTYTGLSADVKTTGGFRIAHAGTKVTVSRVRTRSSSLSGTATVSGHGRMKAFTLGAPTHASGTDPVTYSGFTVTLTRKLVRILDHAFRTHLFARHATIGTASVTIRYQR